MAEKTDQETKKPTENKKEEKEKAKEPTPEEQIKALKEEVEKWKNKYYMAYADTQNMQKNLEKEHSEILRYRAAGFVEKLLPSLECFDIALKNEPDDQVLKNYLIGFRYVYKMLLDALDSEGVKEIEPKVGDKFDVNTMEAVEAVDDEKPDIIKEVRRKGYILHDKVLRHSQVVVTKLPTPKKEEAQDETKDNENSAQKDA